MATDAIFKRLKDFLTLNGFERVSRQQIDLNDKSYDHTQAIDPKAGRTNITFNTDDSPEKVLKKIDERRQDFNED